jgi:hypothetical protein
MGNSNSFKCFNCFKCFVQRPPLNDELHDKLQSEVWSPPPHNYNDSDSEDECKDDENPGAFVIKGSIGSFCASPIVLAHSPFSNEFVEDEKECKTSFSYPN